MANDPKDIASLLTDAARATTPPLPGGWNTEVGASFMPFDSEAEAEDFVISAIRPFCRTIVRQPVFKNGLRPDIGIKLAALPKLPLVIECKRFRSDIGGFSELCSAVAQASTYSELTRMASFVAPIRAANASQLTWSRGPIGAAMLLAGQFNVGALTFTAPNDRFRGERIGALILAGAVIATFSINKYGDPDTTLHSNAEGLLSLKSRSGSQTWRTKQG